VARVHHEDPIIWLITGFGVWRRRTRFCVTLGDGAVQVLGELTLTSSSQEDARRSSSSAAIIR
jgi:hypothetical protein